MTEGPPAHKPAGFRADKALKATQHRCAVRPFELSNKIRFALRFEVGHGGSFF
jgi:hypothetical protein